MYKKRIGRIGEWYIEGEWGEKELACIRERRVAGNRDRVKVKQEKVRQEKVNRRIQFEELWQVKTNPPPLLHPPPPPPYLDPEWLSSKDKISHGAATDGGDESDADTAEEVHLL